MRDDSVRKARKFSGSQLKGTMVSYFRVVRKIGSTALGEVYLAEDTRLNRDVTLKLLSESNSTDAQTRSHLVERAGVISKLDHPNLLTIYEVGTVAGQYFIAMEYVEGLTLREMMTAGQLSINGVIEIARQVCAAMAEAHENDIVLQNINPDHIIVTSEKQIKVMDFGLIDFAGDTGEICDSLPKDIIAYLPPEQVEGRVVDERSNIFSLGVVLYELMTGLTPYRGTDARALIEAIRRGDVEPPARRNPDVPGELQVIVMKMLEKNPARRYQGAPEIISELGRFEKSESAVIQPIRRKDPWNWVVLAAVIILIMVVLYGYISDYLSQ